MVRESRDEELRSRYTTEFPDLNQLRQPYLRRLLGDEYKNYPQVDHIHFFGFYIGNYPDLEPEKIDALCKILNAL